MLGLGYIGSLLYFILVISFSFFFCGAEDETKSLVHVGQRCAAKRHPQGLWFLWLRRKANGLTVLQCSPGSVSSLVDHLSN